MTTDLGTLEDLPLDYRDSLAAQNLVPLWPALRSVLPYDKPDRLCRPTLWRYSEMRPLMLRAGDLTPMEKAERRVLMLTNPGLNPGVIGPRATPSIFLGLQMILPGEFAPTHKHSPSAIRFVIEGEGGYTVVEGERCPMEKGDLILTPSGLWHEHGDTGRGPVVWLDALDLPVVYAIEASYATDGNEQSGSNAPDRSQTHYRRAGLMPYNRLGKTPDPFALKRFPWSEVREALVAMAAHNPRDEVAHLAYVNPETGQPCMNILGFSALALRPGETWAPQIRSTSAVLHVIEGHGEATIDGQLLKFDESDTIAAPTWADIKVRNGGDKPAFLFLVDDAPMQRKLGFYETR